MDFIIDGLASGRMVRILSVVDAYTRECLALEADTSLGSGRVIRVLERLIAERGRTGELALRQWSGVHLAEDDWLGGRTQDHVDTYPAGQAHAERTC